MHLKHVPPKQPHPQWTLFGVTSLIYGIEGACDRPQYYALPSFNHRNHSSVRGMGGGCEAVLSKQKATENVSQELASLAWLRAKSGAEGSG
jgi:hypothetical protein